MARARTALPFLLPLGVLLLMVAASYVPQFLPFGQEAVLVVGSIIFVVLLPASTLPADARPTYTGLRAWILNHLIVVAPIGVGLVVAAYLFRQADVSWAALALPTSLVLWALSILLVQARRFVRHSGLRLWLNVLLDFLFVALPPTLVYWHVETLDRFQAFVVLVGFPLAVLVAAHRSRGPSGNDQARAKPRAFLAIAGATCAIVSAVLLLGIAVRVPIERRLIETSQVADRGPELGAFELGDLTDADARQLLFRRFSPVLRMHADERWPASSAGRAFEAVQPRLTQQCADRPCEEAPLEDVLEQLEPKIPLREWRVFPGGVVYPRLVHVANEIEDVGVPSPAREVVWLVQYWLFYPANNWSAPSGLGRLTQTHGGDWEWVGVGIDGSGRPRFVAYSAHCAGTWRPWRETAAVAYEGDSVIIGGQRRRLMPQGKPRPLPSHPLVIVALGSHANYATPGVREPDWTSCRGSAVATPARWLTFAAAAREGTPDLGPFQIPAVLTDIDTEREAGRKIWWGAEGETRLAKIRIVSDEHGPASPAYQGNLAWDRPIEEIFKTDWECDAGEDHCG